nr:probable G-protein coupled receptor 152 [Pelodiscus sinensis]XP_025043605.1 probable G-protein coupled receptor 152 [Pelodiscus sinensis]XP_025043606.1 probable G-protein coupled receptor 152 [Pelodiscus sinensis]|eukprot:XP_014432108.1 probable G-protein coupled receptor 152 [Pelodiscus sinensis]
MESLNTSLSSFNGTAPDQSAIWQGAFLIIILLIGLPANGFIIWLTGWRLRRRGLSVFILSLASSDFLFLCVMVMQIMETLQGNNWVLGAFMCRLRHFLLDLSYHCSLFLLAALSVDRCLLVLLPLWYRCHRPLRLSTYICLGTWVAASLLSIKGFVFPKLVLFKDGVLACYNDRGKYEWSLRFLEVLLEGFFPFVVMVTTHAVTLARTLRRHTRAPSQFYRIVAATLTVYVLLNLPFQITQLLFLVALENQELYSRLIPFLIYTGYLINLNTSINPYIYLIFGSNLCTSCSHPTTCDLALALTEDVRKSPGHTPEASSPL